MAAPMKGKRPQKAVTKDDLRRLMKETRTTSSSIIKRIDHPYAKYNSLGQLSCSLCGLQVKTDKLWTPHVMGRTHKENIAALKRKQETAEVPGPRPPDTTKRKGSALDDEELLKRLKTGANGKGVPNDFFDSKTAASQPKSILKNAPKSILKNATPTPAVIKSTVAIGNYGSSDEDSESEEEMAPPVPPAIPPPSVQDPEASGSSTLPPDFFDASVPKSAEAEEVEASMAEKLPEGFFDDPKQDAKVRKVEYKDKMDEEYALFQRSMKEENTVSEAIMEDEDEQKTMERNMDEIDDQLHRWTQVYGLAKKKEELMSNPPENIKNETKTEDSDAEDHEIEEFLDWRSKEAWK